jgi:hypothetical protein
MVRAALLALAIGSMAASASAMPLLNQANAIARPEIAVNVRIVCEEDGRCYEPRSRRLAARWIYGSDTFSGPGPYTGPGYYGPPGRHWRWWPFY